MPGYQKRIKGTRTMHMTLRLSAHQYERLHELADPRHIGIHTYVEELIVMHLLALKTRTTEPNAEQRLQASSQLYASQLEDIT